MNDIEMDTEDLMISVTGSATYSEIKIKIREVIQKAEQRGREDLIKENTLPIFKATKDFGDYKYNKGLLRAADKLNDFRPENELGDNSYLRNALIGEMQAAIRKEAKS